jgi:hypothetical protein
VTYLDKGDIVKPSKALTRKKSLRLYSFHRGVVVTPREVNDRGVTQVRWPFSTKPMSVSTSYLLYTGNRKEKHDRLQSIAALVKR